MSIEVRVPNLPKTKAHATIAAWHRNPGERVGRGVLLLDLKLDGKIISIHAPSAGVLDAVVLSVGASVKTGQLLALIKTADTYLADDTVVRLNQQRLLEQDGLRRLTGKRVIARDRNVTDEPRADFGAEAQYGSTLQDHPLLDSQQYDGIDANVNPAPPLSDPEARREYDNARNEQQLQHQLKLGMQPGKDTAPKPQGP